MTKQFWAGTVCALSLFMLSACSEERFAGSSDCGRISVQLEIDPAAIGGPQASRASLQEIGDALTPDDFTIRLTDDNGDSREWSYSSFSGVNVKTGTYTLTAFSGAEGEEGFNRAYFAGSETLEVRADAVTEVAVTATLANAAVTVEYTPAFRAYMKNFSAEIRTAGADSGVLYPADETDPAFINPGEAALYVSLTTQQDKAATLKAADFTAEARHHYVVTVDVNGGEIGDAVMTVSFDDTTVAEEREFVLSDQLFNSPRPTVTPDSYDFEFIEGANPAGACNFSIMAPGVMAEVNLSLSGDCLKAQGWPETIDLLKATPEQQALLKSLGLKAMGLWSNPDKMAVIELGNVVKALKPVSGDNTTVLSLEVVDQYGKVSDIATLKARLIPFSLTIDSHKLCFPGETTATLDITFNGNPATDIAFEYENDRGTTDPTTVSNVVDKGNGSYSIDVAIPGNAGDVVLTARAGSAAPLTYTLTRKEVAFDAAVAEADVYSYTALIGISSDDADPALVARAMEVDVKTPATPARQRRSPRRVTVKAEGANIVLTDLAPGTKYDVTLTLADKQKSLSFTTEKAEQLPNGDMETWVQPSKGNNWELLYPGASAAESLWGTNNPMTTSQGSDYAYCRISGTIPTSDAHGGANAALIRTVGWGSGNTAMGSGGNSGKTKYIDAGLLHLGASRSTRPSTNSGVTGPLTTDDLDCGMAFTSRPKSVTFWYKYSAKNASDKGLALVTIYDAGGNVLTSVTTDLAPATAYTEKTLSFDYTGKTAKAARIYVKFLSTNSESFLTKSDANLSGPGFANLSRGTFMGSRLYIDDITLNY